MRCFDTELDTLLTRADVVVIAAPLTPETTSMIGAPQLARMKRGALLINVGRARIIDQAALTDALHSGQLGGASLDVFHQEPLPATDPLWRPQRDSHAPHVRVPRTGHWDEVIDLFADNIARYPARRTAPLSHRTVLGY
jgi:phosphoglycerate dehydrogenase-like enzyme